MNIKDTNKVMRAVIKKYGFQFPDELKELQDYNKSKIKREVFILEDDD